MDSWIMARKVARGLASPPGARARSLTGRKYCASLSLSSFVTFLFLLFLPSSPTGEKFIDTRPSIPVRADRNGIIEFDVATGLRGRSPVVFVSRDGVLSLGLLDAFSNWTRINYKVL